MATMTKDEIVLGLRGVRGSNQTSNPFEFQSGRLQPNLKTSNFERGAGGGGGGDGRPTLRAGITIIIIIIIIIIITIITMIRIRIRMRIRIVIRFIVIV